MRLPRGKAGEDRACEFLRSLGMEVVTRNYRCRLGEIDVIVRDGRTIVFVEVKERRDASHGEAHEAVTAAKRRRVIAAARHYAARHDLEECSLRFDVVSIDRRETGRSEVRHDRGAFDVAGR